MVSASKQKHSVLEYLLNCRRLRANMLDKAQKASDPGRCNGSGKKCGKKYYSFIHAAIYNCKENRDWVMVVQSKRRHTGLGFYCFLFHSAVFSQARFYFFAGFIP
ncbi:hypothetical protein BCR41DRAFT_373021 [Lobosporangium transversale]|uniref:Uncharacterized protein n=1 Tax=Lobosporangium transversale TaxID=64571 RepID=A0A1Y2GF62_9FUNG|nr:hypothetical protein BCR41DRAFT_373021 [Lobosporangium transversale]ORZ09108.1 hypothetical protein BCR41DRAFT_373021 [Lobosporangium transversale]|eukprot:XP_021878735.1 hypothetical protein BCR41DRAFT_373021 [Lobosporangium transversale]